MTYLGHHPIQTGLQAKSDLGSVWDCRSVAAISRNFYRNSLRLHAKSEIEIASAYLGSYAIYAKYFYHYPHIFKVLEFNEVIFKIVGCKRKKKQDGRSETGNTYISTIISRSCMIPKTISTLLRLRNSTELFPT